MNALLSRVGVRKCCDLFRLNVAFTCIDSLARIAGERPFTDKPISLVIYLRFKKIIS